MNGPWVTMNVAQSMRWSVVPLSTTPPIAIASGCAAWAARIRSSQSAAGRQWSSVTATISPRQTVVAGRPHLEDRFSRSRKPHDVGTDIVDAWRRTTASVDHDDLATDASNLFADRVDRETGVRPAADRREHHRDTRPGDCHRSGSFWA